MSSKLRPYEPLLMTVLRLGDALLGSILFGVFLWYAKGYSRLYIEGSVLIFFAIIVCFNAVGLYRSWRVSSFLYEFHQVVAGCVGLYVTLFAVGYLLELLHAFPRYALLSWAVAFPTIIGLERWIIRTVLRYYRKKGKNIRRVVIAGAGELGERLVRWMDENPWSGTRMVGFFDNEAKGSVCGYPVIGTLKDLPEFVREHGIENVYLTLHMGAEAEIQWLLGELADSTSSVYFLPNIFVMNLILGGNIVYLDGLAAISLRDTPLRGINALLKRVEDLALASMILILTAPIMLIIGIAIKATSPGPIIFKQWRYGLNGRPIKVYKFRTMCVCEDGYCFKQATVNDQRVTRVGAFLRRTSLDELPQFFNVIQGRMSIVGPRPHPIAMNEQYRKVVPGYMLRHKVKPGITGLAQVNGWRGETDTTEKITKRVEFDLEYLRQWSLFLDMKIIAKTVLTNSWRTNAY